MGLLLLVLIILIIISACFIINFITKPRHLVKACIGVICLVVSIFLLIYSWNKYTDSMNGIEVATYSNKEYDIDAIFLEYYTRQELHDNGFYYKFEMIFDATNEEYLEIRKGYGDYDNTIRILYHKYPRENSFLDPFDLNDYKK